MHPSHVKQFLQDAWQSLLICVQFLTSLPVHKCCACVRQPPAAHLASYALFFYPLVGLLIGAILLAVGSVLLHYFGHMSSAYLWISAFVLMVWVGITGGLHLDGLADSADAWLGGLGDQDKTLTIMKDPRCGAMAVLTLVLVLLLKWTLLVSLLQPEIWLQQGWLALLLIPSLCRWQVMSLVTNTPYARTEGLGRPFKTITRCGYCLQGWTFLLVAVALVWWGGYSTEDGFTTLSYRGGIHALTLLCVLMLVSIVFSGYLRYLMQQRIGGWTGDTAGAHIELSELLLLLISIMLLSVIV